MVTPQKPNILSRPKVIFDTFLKRRLSYAKESFKNNVSNVVTTITANLIKNSIKSISEKPKKKNSRNKRNVPKIDFALIQKDMIIQDCFIFKNELVKVEIKGPIIAEEGDLILKIFLVGLNIITDQWISIIYEEVISLKGSTLVTLPKGFIWTTNSKEYETLWDQRYSCLQGVYKFSCHSDTM